MEQETKNYQHIKGWGIDANPHNNPTYPIKKHAEGSAHTGGAMNNRPAQQQYAQEILVSKERSSGSAVVGETVPPTGLSGLLRRYAFTFGESEYGHWLPLLMADRINEVEGVIDDFSKGRIPNFFMERGGRAFWKYNRNGVLKKLVLSTCAVGLLGGYLFWRMRKK